MSGSRRGRPRYRRSELERLVDRTVLGPTHPELGTCWLFTGTTTPYGRITKAQDSYTHRLGWKLLRGAIPDGMELHHRCGVYACWNPDHLQVVTHAENLAHKRKTHCQHGHPLSGENLRIDPRTGARICRACLRENQRRLRAKAGGNRTSDLESSSGPRLPGRPADPSRSDLERLLDDTVLGPTHLELGTCWLFTRASQSVWPHCQGTGQLYSPARLEAPAGPNTGGNGAASPLRRPGLLEPRPPGARNPRREPAAYPQNTLQTWPSAVG
jgi:hypothetical protein